jgi:hypothetical protein
MCMVNDVIGVHYLCLSLHYFVDTVLFIALIYARNTFLFIFIHFIYFVIIQSQ